MCCLFVRAVVRQHGCAYFPHWALHVIWSCASCWTFIELWNLISAQVCIFWMYSPPVPNLSKPCRLTGGDTVVREHLPTPAHLIEQHHLWPITPLPPGLATGAFPGGSLSNWVGLRGEPHYIWNWKHMQLYLSLQVVMEADFTTERILERENF